MEALASYLRCIPNALKYHGPLLLHCQIFYYIAYRTVVNKAGLKSRYELKKNTWQSVGAMGIYC